MPRPAPRRSEQVRRSPVGARVGLERLLVVIILLALFLEHLFELLGELRVLLEGGFDVVQEAVGHFAEAIHLHGQPRDLQRGLEQRKSRHRIACLQVGRCCDPQAYSGDAARRSSVQQRGDERCRAFIVRILELEIL